MAEPLVTVITTAFDRDDTLASTVDSVKAQTFTDFEHLIAADDGSSDDTVAVSKQLAEGDERIRVIDHPHTNQPGGINIALAAARGRYVCFIDSDDVMMPTYVERMLEPWQDDPELGFAYTDAWNIDHDSKRIRRTTFLERYEPRGVDLSSAEQLLTALLDLNFISEESMVRRDVLAEIGGFDETMTHSTDYDVWARVLARGHRGIRVPGKLLIQRSTSTSLSRNAPALAECNAKIMNKLIHELPASPRVKELAAKRLVEIEADLRQLNEPGAGQRAVAAARGRAGAVKRRLRAGDMYFDTPPDEVTAAFPDLESL